MAGSNPEREQNPEIKSFENCQYCGHKAIGINYAKWHCPNCANIGDPKTIPLKEIRPLHTLTEGSKIVMTPEEITRRIAAEEKLNETITARRLKEESQV